MKLLFVSLGCDKNLVDSEEMLGLLTGNGFEIVDDETEAEAIVVNTCCFINDAKEESVNTILEMAEYKKTGSCKVLVVTGCMAQRYKNEIIEEVPEVDAVLGTTSYGDILKAIREAMEGKHFQEFKDIDYLPEKLGKRVLTTGGHFGYLKIAEGCDKHCTYCIIPKLRGKFRSVPMERLVTQAKEMAEEGVKELILVAQETTVYGTDIYGKKSLHILLKELCKIKGIRWIRVLYCYPEEIYDELIQTMKEEKKICHYLDLPIQHASDRVLKRMGRRTTKQELVERAYQRALEKLCTLPREQYVELLAAMLVRASSTGKEEVIFSPRDREDAGRAAVSRANELLAREAAPELPLGDGAVASFLNKVAANVSALAQGTAMLTVSEETRAFSGGFILKNGRIEVNCTFDALVRSEREQTAGAVAKLLFPET